MSLDTMPERDPQQEIEETTPLLDDSQPDGESRSRTATTKVPEVEIHLYKCGKGPIDVFKSNLGGWEQDQLEVRSILDKYGLKSIFAFNVEKGRGVPIRFHPRNGRSVLTYRDGAVIYIDGEPQDSMIKPITRIVLGVVIITLLITFLLKDPPAWIKNNISMGNFPPWVLACIVIVFTRARKRTRDFFRKYGCDFSVASFVQNMEEAHSVNSPRRVLSFSKRRKQKPGFQDSDSISSSPFRASQVHGPKPSEVYGFVGSISTVVATVIFLIWAYIPDKLLESIGIHYYPSRYWVLAMPTYLMVILLLALVFYIGLNFTGTPHPTSLNTLFDEYSREPGEIDSQMEEGDERPIDPISDIDITRINDLMFNSSDAK